MSYCKCLTHFYIERMTGGAPFCLHCYYELVTHMIIYWMYNSLERVILSLDYVFKRYVLFRELFCYYNYLKSWICRLLYQVIIYHYFFFLGQYSVMKFLYINGLNKYQIG